MNPLSNDELPVDHEAQAQRRLVGCWSMAAAGAGGIEIHGDDEEHAAEIHGAPDVPRRRGAGRRARRFPPVGPWAPVVIVAARSGFMNWQALRLGLPSDYPDLPTDRIVALALTRYRLVPRADLETLSANARCMV